MSEKAGKIYNNRILDSQDKKTDYYIYNNQIYSPGGATGYFIEDNYIKTGSGTTGFFIQDGKIIGPSDKLPWT